jgi:hypothetical protein
MFHPAGRDETQQPGNETISPCDADAQKPARIITPCNPAAASAAFQDGDAIMRTFSFILAFGIMLAGPSFTTAESNLPNAGAFSYGGSPPADAALDLAHLTLTRRSRA